MGHVSILVPKGGLTPVTPGQKVHCEANTSVTWTARINGGTPSPFGSVGIKATYIVPSSVSNTGTAGKGVDQITIRAEDAYHADQRTLELSQGAVFSNCTVVKGCNADSVSDPNATPTCGSEPGGVADAAGLLGMLQDEDNGLEDLEGCTSCGEETECKCLPPCKDEPPEMGKPGYADLNSSADGVNQSPAAMCNWIKEGDISVVSRTLDGQLSLKSGCGMLRGRGGLKLDLGVNFSSVPDGLTGATEQPAGVKKSFGWQVRLIQDTVGNVAIYWGDRAVESWPTSDGGSTFSPSGGTFGTLTKQANGSFTRRTKQGMYYDFDSNGRIQTIKDRSVDGNVIYYNYDGGNRVVKIYGPGTGYQAYFLHDVSSRVIQMQLGAQDTGENRYHYFEYDAAGNLHKAVGPEMCVTYFDHDANSNVIRELNADNFRTYFTYGTETIPKVKEANLPAGAGLYYTYDGSTAKSTAQQAGAALRYYEYQGITMPVVQRRAGGAAVYYDFDVNGKPIYGRGTDGSLSYWEWDTTGQVTSQKFAGGRVAYFTYGTAGTVTSQKDVLGRTTYFNYDAQDYQKNWIDALGQTTYFERDSFGQMVSKKDRRGNVRYYTYDSRGNHTSTKHPDGTVRYFDYNSSGELTLQIDELAKVTYYDRDRRGRITKWKDFLGQATEYGYDNRSNRTVMIDRRGNAWYWEYDGLSRVTRQRTALLNSATFNYNPDNTVSSQVDPRGNPTYFYYTAGKQRLAVENALKERTYYTYTSAGQVESEKDARGCVNYFTYTNRYLTESEMDGERNVSYHEYDLFGNRVSMKDPRGNATYYAFDALNRRTSIENALRELNYFYYDQEANVTAQEDALQRRTYFYFDSRDRLFCQEDAQKNRSYFTYTARSERSSAKDARGSVSYFYQDALARQFAVRDARQNVSYLEYDAEGDQVASKTARGFTTYFTFDKDRRQESVKTALGEFTYFTYDGAANRTSAKDARGNLSYFYFDGLNRTFSSEDAKQARTYLTYDASGNQSSVKDPLGRVTYFYHDCAERQFAVRDAALGLRYFTYDQASNQDSVKDERSNVTYMYFDALNRVFGTRNPVQALAYFTFDKVGNRTSVKDPLARFNYFYYDTLNRLQASEDGLQRRTYFEYDQVGSTVSVKNPRLGGEVGIQYFTYNETNHRNSMKDEVAKVWYYDYDPNLNLSKQTNPLLAPTYWNYDALDRKEKQTDPLSRTWYWTYDAVGNVSSLKDGKAQTTSYNYDTVNLNDRIDYPDTAKHYFEYDLARQRTASNDPLGRTSFGYDNLGRMTFRGNPGSENLYYEYDATSNRTSLKDPSGVKLTYDYDAANRMKEVASTQYSGFVAYYEHNLADQMVHEKRKNTTVTYHAYDAAARVSLIHHRKSAGTLIESWTYTRDEGGNPIRIQRGSDSMHLYFNYDQANRVTKEAWRANSGGSRDKYGFQYEYDPAGNRNRKTNLLVTSHTYWNYDLADQMTIQKGGTTTTVYFTFDANGNLEREHDVNASAGRTYYEYEPRNLLTKVDFPGATATNYFYYNAQGERVRKDDSTAQKKYTWDGLMPVLEKNLAGSVVQRMVKGYTPISGIGEYCVQDLAGTLIYPHKNQVGTTMRHTDAAQNVDNTYEYDAWGQPFVTTQAADTGQQYRYTGKELDPDFVDFNSVNRRYHFPFRFYVPFRGVFGQVDPLYRMGDLSIALFVFVAHRPTNWSDPLGLQEASTICGSWIVRPADVSIRGDQIALYDKSQVKPGNTVMGFQVFFLPSMPTGMSAPGSKDCCCKEDNIILSQAVSRPGYGTYMDVDRELKKLNSKTKGGVPIPPHVQGEYGRRVTGRKHSIEDAPTGTSGDFTVEVCAICREKGKTDVMLGCVGFVFPLDTRVPRVPGRDPSPGDPKTGAGKGDYFGLSEAPKTEGVWEKATKSWAEDAGK